MGSKRHIFSAIECVLAVQGHSRLSTVDDFGANRKRIYDFLFVINSIYCSEPIIANTALCIASYADAL